ncbi:MAG: DUF4440 domain-containing protein [Gemmatimonadetes bacterium]|nr:nuclear transport factor 2 family protein [Gemmatimonadota bacterium]NIR78911.1 nuclear transport factor 2 family protein [Gemmatimonadota bacterium]NIT87546.1 nuclear transport factor 2 family protein [Gemmatimonadota bacterium]NIU31414.1 nuclear transport factor 2 family protein [Gemmatimonadota bacterium]NIU36099.1 DUF4440 domain-containing protein [Gemmatimonadota bacterium]
MGIRILSRPLVLLSVLGLVGAALNLSAQEPDASSADAEAVSEVVRTLAAQIQAKEMEPLDTLFAPGRDVHILEGSGVDHGWAEYRDHHLVPELEEMENLSYRYHGVEAQVRGDVAWASFQYELGADLDDERIEVEGRGTAILERLNGGWRVVHLHTSGRRTN